MIPTGVRRIKRLVGVLIASISDGHTLVWDSTLSRWRNRAASGRWTYTTFGGVSMTAVIGECIGYDGTIISAHTINLPVISSENQGERIAVVETKAGTQAYVITPNGADTINGAATLSLTTARIAKTFVSDGTSDWKVFAD